MCNIVFLAVFLGKRLLDNLPLSLGIVTSRKVISARFDDNVNFKLKLFMAVIHSFVERVGPATPDHEHIIYISVPDQDIMGQILVVWRNFVRA